MKVDAFNSMKGAACAAHKVQFSLAAYFTPTRVQALNHIKALLCIIFSLF